MLINPTPLTLPPDGAVIVFTTLPLGSYATVGLKYRVKCVVKPRRTHSAYVHLHNVETGAGTFDRGFAYKRAVWEIVS